MLDIMPQLRILLLDRLLKVDTLGSRKCMDAAMITRKTQQIGLKRHAGEKLGRSAHVGDAQTQKSVGESDERICRCSTARKIPLAWLWRCI